MDSTFPFNIPPSKKPTPICGKVTQANAVLLCPTPFVKILYDYYYYNTTSFSRFQICFRPPHFTLARRLRWQPRFACCNSSALESHRHFRLSGFPAFPLFTLMTNGTHVVVYRQQIVHCCWGLWYGVDLLWLNGGFVLCLCKN